MWVGSATDHALQRRLRRAKSVQVTISVDISNFMLSITSVKKAIDTMTETLQRGYSRNRRKARAEWPLWSDYAAVERA